MVQDKGKLVHATPANELTEKLFGIESVICKLKEGTASATSIQFNSDVVPSGKIWKITHISTWNNGGATATRIRLSVVHDAVEMYFHDKEGSTAQYLTVDKHVELYLNADDYIRVDHSGIASGNICYLNIFGYEMNAP